MEQDDPKDHKKTQAAEYFSTTWVLFV